MALIVLLYSGHLRIQLMACSALNIKNKVCGAYFIHDSFAILTASAYKQSYNSSVP